MTARSFDELASAMYASAPPAAPLAPAPEVAAAPDEPASQRSLEELAEHQYPEAEQPRPLAEVSPELQAERDARRMYDAQLAFKNVIPEQPDEAFEAAGISAEDGRHGLRELREMAADFELGASDIEDIRGWVTSMQRDPQPAELQRADAMAALEKEFGRDAQRALADAKKLLRRDPRTLRVLTALGLLNHPGAAVLIAKKAHAARSAGRLK